MGVPETRLDQFDNSGYRPGSIPARVLWTVVSGLFFQTWIPWPSGLKRSLLRLLGARVGSGVVIKPRVTIKYPWKLAIGDHSWIGEQVWIDNLDQVTIGAHVCISQGALLLCGNHNYKKPAFDLIVKPITVEQGGWVGAQTVVCPGVTVGSHAVLSVGSTATSDLEPYSIYKGNPAEKVKDRVIDPS